MEVKVSDTRGMIIENASDTYSPMLGWEVWNFMSVEHGKVTFDERNIINFKGYNDSGKSSMLRALDVLMFNITPNSQVGFIQDEKDYFRVIAYFADGVSIIRDKYINGQNLYEMYKYEDCIYSTRADGVLTRVSEVPQVIQDYLGVVTSNGLHLNSRSCFEQQLLVQTTGSENYKFLNEVLKSEEISKAGTLLNTDRNALATDMNTATSQLETYEDMLREIPKITSEMISGLQERDRNLDASNNKLVSLNIMGTGIEKIRQIPNIPLVPTVDWGRLSLLNTAVTNLSKQQSIPSIPEVPTVNTTRLSTLHRLQGVIQSYQALPDIPKVYEMVDTYMVRLLRMADILEELKETNELIEKNKQSLDIIAQETKELKDKMESLGKNYITCTGCGTLNEVLNPQGGVV